MDTTVLDLIREELVPLRGLELRVAVGKLRRLCDEFLLPEPATVVQGAELMTEQEAHDFGRQTVGFGQHAGLTWSQVPEEYVAWLVDSRKDLLRYLRRRQLTN